jgi:hypothetical protein
LSTNRYRWVELGRKIVEGIVGVAGHADIVVGEVREHGRCAVLGGPIRVARGAAALTCVLVDKESAKFLRGQLGATGEIRVVL